MKYLAHKVFAGLGQLIALSILTCSVPSFAQFEVSPDHFDASPAVAKKQAAKTSIKKAGKKAGAGSLSAKAAGKGNKQATQAVAGSNSQASSAAAGPSKSDGKLPAATNAGTIAKKRARANKVVLASTQ